ncbi:MAG: DHH family phosphoesterase [Parachlamydiaceae bacterium]|nr:DHH family phosphoesterase [Parachlamydiaceae bacterium]
MNTKKQIVSSGKVYADIDVLACVLAYSELLTLKGHQASGIITGPWNQTIPNTIKKWPINIGKHFAATPTDQYSFILVDLSDPKFMEEFVLLENVVEVYDHHYGYEKFWKERLPNYAYIEKVGACATLIWEKYKEDDCNSSISSTSANLLYTAIFANTLNFKSGVTDERDLIAFEEISKYINLPNEWKSIYYQEIAAGFDKELSDHIKSDTKTINLEGLPFYFGQIEVWNAKSIIVDFTSRFTPLSDEEWLINIASIEEGRSYIYSNSARLRHKLLEIVDGKAVNEHFLKAHRLWLRKEILRELLTPKT